MFPKSAMYIRSFCTKMFSPKPWIFALIFPGLALGAQYAVLTDDDLPPYKRVLTGIGVQLRDGYVAYTFAGAKENAKSLMARVLAQRPSAIIAVGPKSANAAGSATATIPIVYCLVPRPEHYDLQKRNLVGIRIEQNDENQLKLISVVLPKAKHVLVPFNPLQSAKPFDVARKIAARFQLKLIPVHLSNPNDAKEVLETVREKIDAIWMISDPTVLNLAVSEALLRFATSHRIPIFALNDGFVARGALMSYSIHYGHLGRQAAKIAQQLLQDGLPETFTPPVMQETASVAFNIKTAEQLGVAESVALAMLKFAAENQYTVQVFQ